MRSSREILLIQITDSHLSTEPDSRLRGVQTWHSLQAVGALAGPELARADAVLATGDLSHDGSPVSYERLRTLFAQWGLPVLCLPGNHDDPEIMARSLNGHRIGLLASRTLGAWRIITLNTWVEGSEAGHLPTGELARLETELAEHRRQHVLICMHHHPVAVGSPWMDAIGLDNANELFAIVDRFTQARALLWGHIHQEFDAERGRLRLLGSPSTCVQFRPRTDSPESDSTLPGYRWLRLKPDGALETGVRRLAAWPPGSLPRQAD